MPTPAHIAHLRRFVGTERLVIPSVAVVVHDEGGRLLLVRDRAEDVWGLPAGAIEVGESPEDAARRELLEETGLRPASLRLVGAVGGAGFRHVYPNGDRVEYQVFVYRADAGPGDFLPMDTGEVGDVAWFERAVAPALPLPYPSDLLWRDDGPWGGE